MHCSCPDWAVPCKHLAAVVYIVANEIDKNPFLDFRMHGMDLLEAIRKTGRNATRYVNHLDLQEEPLAGSCGDGAGLPAAGSLTS